MRKLLEGRLGRLLKARKTPPPFKTSLQRNITRKTKILRFSWAMWANERFRRSEIGRVIGTNS